MKKTLIAAAVMATSGIAFAASNVTLYGVIETGVLFRRQNITTQMLPWFLALILVPVGVLEVLKI